MKSLPSEENGISVIVPSFQSNLEQLCRCLKSISNQIADNLNIECYVIFDGEPFKNIQHILDIYPNFHFITIKHSGVSIARNEGIQHSHCRYLTFVDVDDELPDHALKKMYDYAEQNSCDIVQGAYEAVLSTGKELHSYKKQRQLYIRNDELMAFRKDVLHPDSGTSLVWGKLFRRSLIVEGDIEFDSDMEVSEDTAFVFDACSKAHVIGFIPDIVYRYYRSTSSTVSSFRKDYEIRILNAIQHMSEHVNSFSCKNEYADSFNSYVLFHLLLVQQHFIFNKAAPWNEAERRRIYNKTIHQSIFKNALKLVSYRDFPLVKRIALFSLKKKMYNFSKLISYIRYIQLII